MAAEIDFVLRSLVARVAVVRRWLVALAVLRAVVLALLFGGIYVAAYAWLDHRLHLGVAGRVVALLVLVAGLGWLLYRLTWSLLGHISCHNAASYIERKHSFDQQLVTAIEYHESKKDYPYSKALADYLVSQVDGASKSVPFDITVPKWQVYLLGVVTVLGLVGGALHLYDNLAYFSRYFTRLTQPTAVVAPLEPTQLICITKDVIAEPTTSVKLAAEIRGRVPEEGRLVITYRDANDIADTNALEAIAPVPLWPTQVEDQRPQLQAEINLSAGRYLYRFEAERSASEWHNLRICPIPQIETMTAKISPRSSRWSSPYVETVEDYSLQVPEDARVGLTIKASEPLAEAKFTKLDGKTITIDIDDADEFNVGFVADEEGFVRVELLSSEQAPNNKVPPLQITLKVDEPAHFSLLHPAGDYLATNVASVPFAFEVTDDFGLESATLYWEVGGRKPETMRAAIEPGSRKATIETTFEIEDYDLSVGDTILVYAKARDVNISGREQRAAAVSEIYFIEIKPYRMLWFQGMPGLPGQAKQGLDVRELHDALLFILEYTRAILKKTWTIANKAELTDDDKAKLETINRDLEHAEEQLSIASNSPRLRPGDREIIKGILDDYDDASRQLARHRAKAAVPPEKEAYVALRKLVQELAKCLPMGGTLPETPDRVVLEDEVHLSRYEKERIEWELKKLADKLASIEAKQKELKKAFEHFLEEQKKKAHAQDTTDEEAWLDPAKDPDSNKKPEDGMVAKAPPAGASKSIEGAVKPPKSGQGAAQLESKLQDKGKGEGGKEKGEGEGKGKGKGKGEGEGEGEGKGKGKGGSGSEQASMQERLAMLTAKQKALAGEIAQLKERLGQLPPVDAESKDSNAARQAVQDHLENATDKMQEFDELVRKSFYRPDNEERLMARAGEKLTKAAEELDLARQALEGQVELSADEQRTKTAEEIAKELMALADEFDENVTPAEKERMLAALEAADEMLKQIAPYEVNITNRPERDSDKDDADYPPGGGGGGGDTGGGGPRTTPPGKTDGGRYVGKEEAEAARFLARKFWSVAVNAKKQHSALIEDDASDAQYRRQEKEFFEKTAEYKQD